MSLFRIAWRSIQQRGLASCLTTLSMALGVMLVVAVLSIHGVVYQSFRNNSSLGYNMIVGAKGGPLQLTLNTVYFLSKPVENLPYTYYAEFLTADRRDQELRYAKQPQELGRDGKYGYFVSLVVPICMGDYYSRFRVIGTIPEFFDQLTFGRRSDRKFEFAQGRNLEHKSAEYGYFEAVVGSVVAAERQLKLGDRISTTHGDPEGEGHGRKFAIVGILAPSGTPNDRAVFVNIEGFYLMEGHAKPAGEAQPSDAAIAPAAAGHDRHAGQAEHDQLAAQPLPVEEREVTAILVRTVNDLVTMGLENAINEGTEAQAVLPIREITNLFEIIVKPFQRLLLLLTATICVVSGVSILVSIYNSMSERRREIAVMRALGAGRGTVMMVILLESLILSAGGGLLGWAAAHGLNGLAGPMLERRVGVSISFFDFAPAVRVLDLLGGESRIGELAGDLAISSEFLLIPLLIVLAVAAGFLPALAAYRTDVAKSLGK